MGNIANFKYPDVSIAEASKIAKTIYDFPSHSMSVQLLAEKLGLSPRGGWTGMILFSLKRYGLAEGRGLLHTTPLAEKLVNPLTTQELQATKEEIFNKIELWVRIKNDYGTKLPSSEFCSYLAEKLIVDRQTAQAKYEKIAKLYTESYTFCFPPMASLSVYDTGRGVESAMVEKRDTITQISPIGTVSYGSSDEYGIWVKKDIASINFAASQLETIKAWLELQKAKLSTEKMS